MSRLYDFGSGLLAAVGIVLLVGVLLAAPGTNYGAAPDGAPAVSGTCLAACGCPLIPPCGSCRAGVLTRVVNCSGCSGCNPYHGICTVCY